jgi:hypothetical protein
LNGGIYWHISWHLLINKHYERYLAQVLENDFNIGICMSSSKWKIKVIWWFYLGI